MTFIWRQFYIIHQTLKLPWKLLIKISFKSPSGQWVNIPSPTHMIRSLIYSWISHLNKVQAVWGTIHTETVKCTNTIKMYGHHDDKQCLKRNEWIVYDSSTGFMYLKFYKILYRNNWAFIMNNIHGLIQLMDKISITFDKGDYTCNVNLLWFLLILLIR